MMVKNEHTVVIDRSREQVFQFVTDFETWRQWHGSDQSKAEKITPGPVGVGTVWRMSGPVQGQVITVTIEITRYEPHSEYAFRTTSGPIEARQSFTLKPVEAGTQLTTVLELANPRMAEPAREQWNNDLLGLKSLLEEESHGVA